MKCIKCGRQFDHGEFVVATERVTWAGVSLLETTLKGTYAHLQCPLEEETS